MFLVSVTRVRLRSLWYVLPFFIQSRRAQAQLRDASGFCGGALLADRNRTFWTLSVWDSAEDMRAYILSGAHKAAMPRLLDSGDEASVVHWEQPDAAVPSWQVAEQQMRQFGRASKLRYPSPDHAMLNFPAPRLTYGKVLVPR